MNIYVKLKKDISTVLEHKSKFGIEATNTLVEYMGYPEDLANVLKTNPELALKISTRYGEITQYFIDSEDTLENLLEFTNKKLINKLRDGEINPKKEIFIKVDTQIYNYLREQNYFQKSYDELEIANTQVSKQDIMQYKLNNPSNIIQIEKFDWRQNQLDVISHIKTHGITTGIQLQATGCGKTYIILKYIDFAFKSNPKCKIILFTERVSILADLFDFKSIETKSNQLDSTNIKFWKEKDICDLTQFNIIDRVTVKKSDWIEQLNQSTKPTLLVINRAYLTLNTNYKNINGLSLVLHDECHNVASNKCFEFLKFIKCKHNIIEKIKTDNNDKIKRTGKTTISIGSLDNRPRPRPIPIVGFSATPLRAGKTKTGDNTVLNRDRLVEIYGKENEKGQLNLITNYNMIYAISSDLILPPRFYWFDIENYQIKDKESKVKKQISKPELGSVMKILDEIIPLMPNRKFVGWCGTIPLCDEWYDNFVSCKEMYPNLKNIKLFKDYSKKNINSEILGYNEFKILKSGGIMFCAQKHREGSDISKLDGCIFLDKVKVRGAIPFIQSIGRVLRKEPDPDPKKESNTNLKKTCGFVIDGVVRDNQDYEKNIVDKILGYYFALNDIASLEDDNSDETTYSKYTRLLDLINFDPDEKIIKLKLDKTVIEINCKKLDWVNIIKNFDSILEKKVNLNPDEKLRIEFEKLKERISKKKFSNMNKFERWAKKKNIDLDPQTKYSKFWTNSFDFLSIDTSNYIDKNIFKKICIKSDIKNISELKKLTDIYDNIPYDPCEFYKITNFKDFMGLEDIYIS